MTTCKNCNKLFEGNFCPECGQKDAHRLTVLHLGHEVFHAVTHTDKGIFFLIKELFLRPGKTVKAYIDGKRKRYFNPFTFLLLMMALNVFVARKTNYYEVFQNTVTEWSLSMIQSTGKTREEALKSMQPTVESNRSTMSKTLDNSKLLTFLFIPILALLTRIFFFESKFNYAENLVLNIMITAETTIFFVVIAIIPFLFDPVLGSSMLFVHYLVTVIYSFIAYRQFFGDRWSLVIIKGIIVQAGYLYISFHLSKLVFQFV